MSVGYQRWYDSHVELSQAMRTFFLLPEAVQLLMAEGIARLSEIQQARQAITGQTMSMGSERIMGLHKSKRKARQYDKNPVLHHAINQVFVLDDDGRLALARQLLSLEQAVIAYFEHCKVHRLPVSMGQLEDMRNIFLNLGDKGRSQFGKTFIAELESRLLRDDITYGECVTDTLSALRRQIHRGSRNTLRP